MDHSLRARAGPAGYFKRTAAHFTQPKPCSGNAGVLAPVILRHCVGVKANAVIGHADFKRLVQLPNTIECRYQIGASQSSSRILTGIMASSSLSRVSLCCRPMTEPISSTHRKTAAQIFSVPNVT